MTMGIDTIYRQMWTTAFPKIKKGEINIDKQIDDPADSRRGMTLLIRPNQKISKKLQTFLAEVKVLEPYQYYYPTDSLHVTLLSIFSGESGFKLSSIELP